MLTIERAKKQLQDSITQYRALDAPLTQNSDNVDYAIMQALSRATTWQQVGVLAATLPGRMGLLQKPIAPLGSSYKESIAMRFDEGRFGWYWHYGATPDCKNGFLVCVFRYPTKAQSSDSRDSIFSVCGYVVEGGETRQFGTLDGPIMCPGEQVIDSATGLLTLRLDFSSLLDDASVFIKRLQMDGAPDDFKTIGTTIEFKSGARYVYSLTSDADASYEGESGCSPTCAGGAGTNYWSFTNMLGVMLGDVPGSPSPATAVTTTQDVLIGWFDHQWASFVPRSVLVRAIAAALSVSKAAVRTAWIFLTLQVSPELQYSVSFTAFKTQDEIANVKIGSVFAAEANRFAAGAAPVFNVPATIEVMGFAKQDARLPNDIRVTVDGVQYRLQAAVDGRVVLPDASINLEALSLLYKERESMTSPSGVGCIEITGFHNVDDDIQRMERVAGINAPLSYFEPQKESKTIAAESILMILGIAIAIILVLSLMIWAIVRAVKRRQNKA